MHARCEPQTHHRYCQQAGLGSRDHRPRRRGPDELRLGAGRYGAELILARAAKARGVPFTLATPSAFSIERLAEEVGGRLWFQLYCVRDLEFRAKLVRRAKEAGYEALLVTVDLPVSGKRERDPRNGFHTPYSPNWRNSKDIILKPA